MSRNATLPALAVASFMPWLLVPAVCAAAGPATLVSGGRSEYVIYLDPASPGELHPAALEIRRVVKASTGVELAVVTTPGPAMVALGDSQAARDSGIRADEMAEEQFVIRTCGPHVFVVGRDTPHGETASGGGLSRGTLFGAYAFLERVVGVRWLMPGEIGEDIPSRSVLTIPPLNLTGKPDFRCRVLQYVQERRSPHSKAVRLWQQRMKLGGALLSSHGHAWDDHPPREEVLRHPEWWPMRGGKRQDPGYGRGSFTTKFCTTNQAYVDAFARSLGNWFERNPTRAMASMSASDGGGWCQCEACREHVEESPSQDWVGAGMYRESQTPVMLTLYNDMAKRMAVTHPGKLVCGYAYAAYTYPPRQPVRLADNVHIQLAPRPYYGLTLYRDEYRAEFPRLVAAWRAMTPNLGYTSYDMWLRTHLGTPLPPVLSMLKTIYPALKANDVVSVYTCGHTAWGYGAAHNYLNARLMWDANLDVDAAYEEFLKRAYGRGARQMAEIYDLIDRRMAAYEKQETSFNYDMSSDIVMKVYLPLYSSIERLYREASSAAESGKQRQRLELFADNMKILHRALWDAGVLKAPETSGFHLDDEAYAAFSERVKTFIAVNPLPETDVGFITKLFLPERRTLTIPRRPAAVSAPTIDGDPSEPVWQCAAVADDFRVLQRRGQPQHPTTARLIYDDEALYVAFECREPNADAIVGSGAGRDSDLVYSGDCVELFFSTDTEIKHHFWHLTVSPKNVRWDAKRSDRSEDPEWESAAAVAGDRWTVEMRLPFHSFGLVRAPAGESWAGNLTREDKPSGENSTWTNTEGSFLEPQNFGTWRFEPEPEQAGDADLLLDLRLDAGDGTVARDSSGRGLHGRILGAAWTDAPGGKALRFDGEDDAVDVGREPCFDFGEDQDFTIELALRTRTQQQGCIFILTKKLRGDTREPGYQIYLAPGKQVVVGFVDGEQGIWLTGKEPVNDGAWHSVAVTADRDGDAVLHLDGVVQERKPMVGLGSISSPKRHLRIGDRAYDGDFEGDIANVRIWNGVRRVGAERPE